eukprot:2394094-Pleurochrysis_carterae.AAC.4
MHSCSRHPSDSHGTRHRLTATHMVSHLRTRPPAKAPEGARRLAKAREGEGFLSRPWKSRLSRPMHAWVQSDACVCMSELQLGQIFSC